MFEKAARYEIVKWFDKIVKKKYLYVYSSLISEPSKY